jgi:LacI family transcriptional regulator
MAGQHRRNGIGTAQPASIASVALRAGVSIATVSRVINGVANKASPATIARVRAAVAELDYRPSSAGRSLRRRESRLVAILAANLANPAMAAIAASAEIALRERGLVMVLCDTHDKSDLQDEYLREMRAQQARAIVLLGAVESPLLAAMRDGSTPLIFVNRRDPGGGHGLFVGIDNHAAGRDVAASCLARGLKHPAILHGALASSATRDRVAAMVASFAQAGRPLTQDRIIAPHAREHLTIGFEAGSKLTQLKPAPDVAICTSDLIAFGLHRYWRESGLSIPMPPLIGFDDSPMNEWIAPWLSSVRITYQAFGPAIVAQIESARSASGPRDIILPHRLIVRDMR